MAVDDIRRMRTVGLLAEGGAGKTTLAEALLFAAGATTRLGRVDDGSSTFDFEPEEARRKITLSTAFHSLSWKRHDILLVDPPGYANFLLDTRHAMEAMGGAIFVGNPTGNLKVESERVWGWANELQLPRLVYISRMDREEGSLQKALEGMSKTLEAKLVAVQVPIGTQAWAATNTLTGWIPWLTCGRSRMLYRQGVTLRLILTGLHQATFSVNCARDCLNKAVVWADANQQSL